MVATRIDSASASAGTPSAAAACGRGRTRISGRSRAAVDTTFASIGRRRISPASSAAAAVTLGPSAPLTITVTGRNPLELRK
jgi:hypothetical protein